jgi:hypothetical protein
MTEDWETNKDNNLEKQTIFWKVIIVLWDLITDILQMNKKEKNDFWDKQISD